MTAHVISMDEYRERRRAELLAEAVEHGEAEPGQDQCDRCWCWHEQEELKPIDGRIGRERYCPECWPIEAGDEESGAELCGCGGNGCRDCCGGPRYGI